MKTVSGHLVIGKREVQQFKLLIYHTERDIDYNEGGTFGDGIKIYTKERDAVLKAITNLKWIIDNQKVGGAKKIKQ